MTKKKYSRIIETINKTNQMPVFFHQEQLDFKPVYEWNFGKKIKHPETTKRAESILKEIKKHKNLFEVFTPFEISPSALKGTHSYELITLYNTASLLPESETFYPFVFPNKKISYSDPTNILHAGYFCFDSGTPLNSKTLSAAKWSASCAFEAASLVYEGITNFAYALSRPPGHHASKSLFGGYSYFNNSAIACKKLLKKGKVCILDIDFHHGNGTQDLFYNTDEVLTISIHGDPKDCYPYYSGYSYETGKGKGKGFNLNFPLPKGTYFDEYKKVMEEHVLNDIKNYGPDYLIVAAGFDTYKLDQVGDFNLETEDYYNIGKIIAQMGYPTVIVQEGGYYTKDLGKNVVSFLKGINDFR